MRYAARVLLYILFCSSAYASGKIEKPVDYTDLGQFEVKTGIQVSLPYYKPEGIVSVPSIGAVGILVYEIIADEGILNPETLYFTDKRFVDKRHEEKTDTTGEYRTLVMRWAIDKRGDFKRTGIYYIYDVAPKVKYPKKYIVPYGCKEIYLTYRILFRIYPKSEARDITYVESEEYVVKWELIWPPE